MNDIALDSQCFTYLITAIEAVEEPSDQLADQRLALVRSFFYGPLLSVTSTAVEEFKAIRDDSRREQHESWGLVHFNYLYNFHIESAVQERSSRLLTHHRGLNDCRIVAEAEQHQAAAVITYDQALIRRLGTHSTVPFLTPSQYWAQLAVPQGSTPRLIPAHGNPLAEKDWWRW